MERPAHRVGSGLSSLRTGAPSWELTSERLDAMAVGADGAAAPGAGSRSGDPRLADRVHAGGAALVFRTIPSRPFECREAASAFTARLVGLAGNQEW